MHMRSRVTINLSLQEYNKLKKEAEDLGEEMATHCKIILIQHLMKK